MPVPDFILELRERIGHQLLWLPGVTAVVLEGENVLLVRRSDNGEWAPVTGIVDPGEHPVRAAEREVLEETGVVCRVEALAWVNVSEEIVHANGDHAQYLDHTFRCRFVRGSHMSRTTSRSRSAGSLCKRCPRWRASFGSGSWSRPSMKARSGSSECSLRHVPTGR